MTICVAVKVQDCIVFAADSTSSLQTTLQDGSQVTVNTYDNANKVFNLRKGAAIASMTAGIGNLGASSISTITKDFRRETADPSSKFHFDVENYSIEEVTNLAKDYFFNERFLRLENPPQGEFQYWIGGYSSGQDLGEIWRFEIRDGDCSDAICEASAAITSTIAWGGAPEAINRLVLGYSGMIGKALEAGGVDPGRVPDAISGIAQFTQAQLAHPAMPTIDAVALARFLAETTKQYVRFSPGGNTVGGSIDIATITKHENFKWVDRKHFYSEALNRLETDHA